jgi:hypothetical protein
MSRLAFQAHINAFNLSIISNKQLAAVPDPLPKPASSLPQSFTPASYERTRP